MSGQIPTQPYRLPSLGFSYLCWEAQISMSPCHHAPHKHLAWQDRSSLLCFPCWELGSVSPRWAVGSHRAPRMPGGISAGVPAWPLLPASSHLHSTTSSSSCSTWNSHFSFTKIKNQAEASQNLRWEALLRTEARWAVFQRLIAFSECISIYIFPQHWNS